MVAQPSPAGLSLSSEVSSTHPDAELSFERRCDNAPESLAAVAKAREVVEAGIEEWSDEAEENKTDAPPSRWRRVLVPGSIVLLITTLISLLLIVGSHWNWWTL
jgi:hypothetical protein